MPYYNDPSSDIQQGMQGSFNPMTGRLNGGNMVLEFLARMAGQKEQKKKEQWEMEDRDWQQKQRGMAEEQYSREKEQSDWEKKTRVDPGKKATFDLWMGNMGAKAAEQRELRRIEAQAKATKEVNSAKPPTTSQDKTYEWQSMVARSSDLVEKELDRLNQEYLVYAKQISDNPGDPEVEAGLKKYIDDIKRRANKAKVIQARLARLKTGDPIPKDLEKALDEYITPAEEPRQPMPEINLLSPPFGPKVGQLGGGQAPAKKMPLAPLGSLPAGAKFTGQHDAEGYPLYKFKDGSVKRWKG